MGGSKSLLTSICGSFHCVFDRIAACSKRCTLRKGGAHTRALRGSLGRYCNIDEVDKLVVVMCRITVKGSV